MSSLFITCEPMLWYYGVIFGHGIVLLLVLVLVSEVLVGLLVLEATVLETSLQTKSPLTITTGPKPAVAV